MKIQNSQAAKNIPTLILLLKQQVGEEGKKGGVVPTYVTTFDCYAKIFIYHIHKIFIVCLFVFFLLFFFFGFFFLFVIS